MKSKKDQLIKRGYLAKEIESKHIDKSFEEKIKLLQSKEPTDRTFGARLLKNSKNEKSIDSLITALTVEEKLYTKIEICNSLVSCGQGSIKPLVKIIGQVGTNQHKDIPDREFIKNSYPLPRDIASRTLIRFEQKALDDLIKILVSENKSQISEAVDAIGYICFYNYNSKVYKHLLNCYSENSQNNLIKWKIIRAMSAFPESEIFLLKEKQSIHNERLLKEIDRSISLTNKRRDK